MKHLAFVIGLALAPVVLACGTMGFNVPTQKDLAPGGVYVAYNMGCQTGCDQVKKGDLIQAVNGQSVKSGLDFDRANVVTGQPVKLAFLRPSTGERKEVQIVATPKELPPLENVPPFWTVGAEELNQAPEWARKRMFGHAMPSCMLVNSNGGTVDGRSLYGKKHLLVFWDHQTREEQAAAVAYFQVLQKAQADLNAKAVDVLFVQHQFVRAGTSQARGQDVGMSEAGGGVVRKAPMNDSDLRAFQAQWQVKTPEGAPLPQVPTYRFPNKMEYNAARELGLEGAYTFIENLTESPAIVLLDDRGIVRWHSQNVTQPPPDSQIKDPGQYTIIEAVNFASNKL